MLGFVSQVVPGREPLYLGFLQFIFTNAVKGTLKIDFDGGRNAWRTMAEMKQEPKKYKGFYEEMEAGIKGGAFIEHIQEYTNEEF